MLRRFAPTEAPAQAATAVHELLCEQAPRHPQAHFNPLRALLTRALREQASQLALTPDHFDALLDDAFAGAAKLGSQSREREQP